MVLTVERTFVTTMTSTADPNPTSELRDALDELDCSAGTIHRADDRVLTLVAHEGMPEEVLDRVETVPVGKGMAGLAAERREPVQICNLQTDDSGVAEDGARATGLEGTIAAPMLRPDGSLNGVIGVGKQREYEFTADEADELLHIGQRIADRS